jgi:hemerythrin-like domain-containing protein
MSFSNRISQTLHDEHGATVALMEKLEQFLVRHRRGALPAACDPAAARLLGELAGAVEAEIERHFAFEEDHLFSYLAAIGDEAIGAHLSDEHDVMRPLGKRLAALARAAQGAGFDAAGWEEFRRLGQEFSERMLAHVQKEEMALLPLLEESMDGETETRLYEAYVGNA